MTSVSKNALNDSIAARYPQARLRIARQALLTEFAVLGIRLEHVNLEDAKQRFAKMVVASRSHTVPPNAVQQPEAYLTTT